MVINYIGFAIGSASSEIFSLSSTIREIERVSRKLADLVKNVDILYRNILYFGNMIGESAFKVDYNKQDSPFL